MAQSLELFTDGSLMNLPPFEVEMRRRLFWQLIVLDGAFSEIRGTPPIIPENSFDTQQPSNIYDEQLSPVAGIIGQAQEKGTEMTCSLLSQSASVIMQLYTAMNPRKKSILEETEASVEAREKVIQARLQELQTKYIDHCDLSVPILRISAEIGRIIILRIWLVTQRPMYTLRAQTTKPARREFVLAAAVSLLELVYGLENFPESAPWVWYYMAYVPWYPMAVILAELCIQTRGLLADRGWMIINKTYELWANRVADSKASSFWRPMKKLLDKAKTARLSNQSSQFSPELENQILQDWTMIGTLGGGAETQCTDFKRLHYASVSQALGRPEELEALLREEQQQQFPRVVQTSDLSNMHSEDFGASVNWEDWESFIQTTIDAENQYFPGRDMLLASNFELVNSGNPVYANHPDAQFLPDSGLGFGP